MLERRDPGRNRTGPRLDGGGNEAMGTSETLLAVERELAAGAGGAYRRHLRDDARVIVPGQALTKDATIAAMDESPGWDEFTISDDRVIELGDDAAVLTYQFSGRRGESFSYSALMSSVYERGDGKALAAGPAPADTAAGWRRRLTVASRAVTRAGRARSGFRRDRRARSAGRLCR
jgi:hypothetical protein